MAACMTDIFAGVARLLSSLVDPLKSLRISEISEIWGVYVQDLKPGKWTKVSCHEKQPQIVPPKVPEMGPRSSIYLSWRLLPDY